MSFQIQLGNELSHTTTVFGVLTRHLLNTTPAPSTNPREEDMEGSNGVDVVDSFTPCQTD